MKFDDFLNIEKNNLIEIDNITDYVIAGVQNYGKGILNKRNVKGSELTMRKYQLIKENQLMWCKVDTKNGAFGVTKREHIGSLASTNMCLANIKTKIVLPDFLQLLFSLDWFYNWITEKSTGTTNRQYLTPPQILELIEIPDFTIAEQKEFIRKHSAFTNGGLSEELKIQQTHLQQLRQAILQEAVQGKLTKQNKADEPADKLLQRIKAEKQKLIAAGKLKKEKELPPITKAEIPFELPKGWVWCRVGEITLNVDYGTSEKAFSYGEVPVLRMGNVQDGELVFSNLKYVRKSIKDLPRLFLKNKDLVFNRTNSFELVGKSGVYYGKEEAYTLASYLIRVTIPNDFISTEFANYYINSKICRETQIEPQITQQTGQANFSGSKLKNILFPLPPLSEQQRIITKVQQLLQMTNQLQQQVAHNQTQAKQLLQAVLKEAFTKKAVVYEQDELLTLAAEQ